MIEQKMAQKNLIYKCIVGSRLYGTNDENSDSDFMGIFIPEPSYVLGNKWCEQVEIKTNPSSNPKANTKDDVDTVIYSLPKMMHMLQNNNPTALEILFAPKNCIIFDSKYGKQLRDNARIFVSKKTKHTYLGYASAQKNKVLHKKDRYSQFVKALEIVEGLKKCGFQYLPQRLELNTDLVEKGLWMAFEKGHEVDSALATINKQLAAYGRRLDQVKALGYDPKFISHVVRLLDEGIQILTEGRIDLPLNNAKLIRDIKQGKYDLPTILKWIEEKEKIVEEAYIHSPLPNTPDLEAINDLQVSMFQEFYGFDDKSA